MYVEIHVELDLEHPRTANYIKMSILLWEPLIGNLKFSTLPRSPKIFDLLLWSCSMHRVECNFWTLRTVQRPRHVRGKNETWLGQAPVTSVTSSTGFLWFSGYDQVTPWLSTHQISSKRSFEAILFMVVLVVWFSMIKLRYWGHFIIIVVGKISFDGMIPHPALR